MFDRIDTSTDKESRAIASISNNSAGISRASTVLLDKSDSDKDTSVQKTTIQRVLSKRQQYEYLANVFNSWLDEIVRNQPGHQQALVYLANNWQQAAELLTALFISIGIDPRPGNIGARNANAEAFPDILPIIRQDMLTPLADLYTFGPTPNFRPVQTIETIHRLYQVFNRGPIN